MEDLKLVQSAEDVADVVRTCLGGFDQYRKYILEECINGAVFWSMDYEEVDNFKILDMNAAVKRGHAVLIKQLIAKERELLKKSFTPARAVLQDGAKEKLRDCSSTRGASVPPPSSLRCEVGQEGADGIAKEFTVDQADISKRPVQKGKTARKQRHEPLKTSSAKEESQSDEDDDQPTSSEVYAKPCQCQPFQAAIGAHGVRILRDNHKELKMIVSAELDKLQDRDERLSRMNFKERKEDRLWRDQVFKKTMKQTNDGQFRGANGKLYRWPRGRLSLLQSCQRWFEYCVHAPLFKVW